MMWVVEHASPEALAPWTKDERLDDAVFRAIAEVPMEWMGVQSAAARLTLRCR